MLKFDILFEELFDLALNHFVLVESVDLVKHVFVNLRLRDLRFCIDCLVIFKWLKSVLLLRLVELFQTEHLVKFGKRLLFYLHI